MLRPPLNKVADLQTVNEGETPPRVFFCEFYEIFKNTFFTENLFCKTPVAECFGNLDCKIVQKSLAYTTYPRVNIKQTGKHILAHQIINKHY